MKELFAVSFTSDLSMEDIYAKVNELGPWRWSMRDSEQWGDYISTRAVPEYGMVKIVTDGGRYVANVKFKSERPNAEAELAELRETLLASLLPAILARDVQPTDSLD
jgi:hypothetical protein